MVGQALKEAQSINKSLSALGDVICALQASAKHIPFRNSKLTQVRTRRAGSEVTGLTDGGKTAFLPFSEHATNYCEWPTHVAPAQVSRRMIELRGYVRMCNLCLSVEGWLLIILEQITSHAQTARYRAISACVSLCQQCRCCRTRCAGPQR